MKSKSTLNQDVKSVPETKKLNFILTLCLMIAGLYCSWSLLNWAIGIKTDNIQNVKNNPITTEVRERQLACLAKNIYYEAANEPFEGKVAVAQVTLNRANSGKFPDDICKVIYQKNIFYEKVVCQFSWYCESPNFLKAMHQPAFNESMNVAKKVLLEGFRLPSLNDALFYHADYVNPGWGKQKITQIGRHIFYK